MPTPSTEYERKIDSAEAAKLNGVSAKTLIRWAQAGMPHFHFEKKYLFRQSEIDAWMESMFRQNGNVQSFKRQAAGGAR